MAPNTIANKKTERNAIANKKNGTECHRQQQKNGTECIVVANNKKTERASFSETTKKNGHGTNTTKTQTN